VFLDDSLVFSSRNEHEANVKYDFFDFKGGKTYRLKIEFIDQGGDSQMSLLWQAPGKDLKKEAMDAVRKSDMVVMCMGLSPRLEGEEMNVRVEGFSGGDRLTLDLPKIQEDLIKAVYALHKPVILVLMNGSAVSINWEKDNIPAILEAWYPGQAAGTAIADVLFGDYNPAGRLPVTFYKSVNDLPAFENYAMKGRTYRYFKGEALYPFGYGLSYTTFAYDSLRLSKTETGITDTVVATVMVTNTGKIAGEEVVQLYIRDAESKEIRPVKTLKGFERISLTAGESKSVRFTITPEMLSSFNETKNAFVIVPGEFQVLIGRSSADIDLIGTKLMVMEK
jgi:beta-glucosidase